MTVFIYLLATDVLAGMKSFSSILSELTTLTKESSMGTYWNIGNLSVSPYLPA